MSQYEYKSPQESNIAFGETIEMVVKAPLIADRIFDAYSQADAYVKNPRSSATPGLILSVINDPNVDVDGHSLNGIYQVVQSSDPSDVDIYGMPVLYLERQSPVQSDWEVEDENDPAYIRNRPTSDYGVFTIGVSGE
jgi:hypothetical protein